MAKVKNPRQSTFFIVGDGIDREVITTDICRYLGNDAIVKPGAHVDKNTGRKQEGFYIKAYRPPTAMQLADLRSDSAQWRKEKRRRAPANVYRHDMLIRSVEHLVPTKKDLPIYLNWPFNSSLCRACADFGAAANIIDARYARAINVSIIPDAICDPFELPTYGTLIWPIGRASITCVFPGEADTIKEYEFFVFENFVFPVIMGREFLRDTGTLDKHQHRLHDRLIVKREIPIVASLGAEEETLTAFIDGEMLDTFPDTGSEVNIMDLDFAKRRGFFMETDDIHKVCFANGSLQDVVGRVTVPLSFSRNPTSHVQFKLVAQLSDSHNLEFMGGQETQEYRQLNDITIAADFYVLHGLKTSIILGEDLLASVDAFVSLSENFKQTTPAKCLYPALATISLFRKAEKRVAAMVRKKAPDVRETLRQKDIADARESDRYDRELERIRYLPQQEQALAIQNNDSTREAYLRARDRSVNRSAQ